jgi:Helix-turn-helix of DDE superfamily endonuclease/DDE superfamily endonuclease
MGVLPGKPGPAAHCFSASKEYVGFMMTYAELRGDRRRLLAVTGMTPPEFGRLLTAFARSYGRRYPADRTAAGRPRQRRPGAGRPGVLRRPEQKLLFLLVYLKAYPLQAVMAELFGLSQPRVNCWLRRLLPVLRDALDDLGALPERDGGAFAGARPPRRLIIDGTERRRQRPKNPEKQAAHYSGRKKVHCDRNVVVAEAGSRRVGFLSRTHPGRSSDKGVADREGVAYPPGAVLHQDGGFQGYRPAGVTTRQAKKKAGRRRADGGGEGSQPGAAARAGAGGARAGGREAQPHRQGRLAEHG